MGHYDGEILSVEEVKARIWNTKDKSAEDEEWLESRSGRSQSVSGSYLLELQCGGKCVDAEYELVSVHESCDGGDGGM